MKNFLAALFAPLFVSALLWPARAQDPQPTATVVATPTAAPLPTPTTGPMPNVPPVIGIIVDPNPLEENGGEEAATATVRRYYTDISQPLTVNLRSDMPQSLKLPRSVTIPSGVVSVRFPVGAVDDTVLNGSRVALVTVTARGFYDSVLGVGINDDEGAFSLEIEPEEIKENGGSVVGTLTRNANLSASSETVSLSVLDGSNLEVPATVTIPAGSTTVSFDITVVDDDLVNGTRNAIVTARRGAINDVTAPSTTAMLTLIDDEFDLTLNIERPTAREGDGFNGPLLTVSRTRGAAELGPVTISIGSEDPTEVLAPVGLLLPIGQREATARLQIVDDGLVDGPQRVRLVANATEYNDATGDVVVGDNDTPKVEFVLSASTANEAALPVPLTGRLRRNTPSNRALSVAIFNSAPGRVRTPAVVTFAPGAVRVEFPLQIIDNSVRDGDANVQIGVRATGFPDVVQALRVLDNDGPCLEVSFSNPQIREKATEDIGRVQRLGVPLDQPLKVNLRSSNTAILQVQADVIIPAGASGADFRVFAADNKNPSDLVTAIIEARAGALRGAAPLDVIDDDDAAILTLGVQAVVPSSETLNDPVVKSARDALFPGPGVDENAGFGAIRVTIIANTAPDSDLIIPLRVTGDIIAPPSVILPFGARSLSFLVAPIDDLLKCNEDRDLVSTVGAEVAGYAVIYPIIDVSATDFYGEVFEEKIAANKILVVDTEPLDCPIVRNLSANVFPRVSRSPVGVAESDGIGAAQVAVSRSDDAPQLELVVDLRVSLPDDTLLSTQRIIMPPYRSQGKVGFSPPVLVRLDTLDNMTSDECRDLSVVPTAVGFRVPGSTEIIPVENYSSVPTAPVGLPYIILFNNVRFYDDESAIGALTIAPNVISETAASGVATGTINRLRRPDGTFVPGELTIKVRSLNTAEVGVSPANRRDPQGSLSVRLPASLNSVSFNIIAIDDTIVDGTQRAKIVATTDCSVFETTADVIVRDNDRPALTMRFTPSLLESAPASILQASLSRNTPTDRDLVVSLRCSNARRFNLPATVTIPKGQREIVISGLSAVNDTLRNGDEIIKIAAAAPGHASAVVQTRVIDDDN